MNRLQSLLSIVLVTTCIIEVAFASTQKDFLERDQKTIRSKIREWQSAYSGKPVSCLYGISNIFRQFPIHRSLNKKKKANIFSLVEAKSSHQTSPFMELEKCLGIAKIFGRNFRFPDKNFFLLSSSSNFSFVSKQHFVASRNFHHQSNQICRTYCRILENHFAFDRNKLQN